jgi:hypothetical protein
MEALNISPPLRFEKKMDSTSGYNFTSVCYWLMISTEI